MQDLIIRIIKKFPELKGDDGKSAYEIAVDNGYVGTEEEWLLSLVGIQGEPGPQGDQGEPGPQGEQGQQGERGPAGVSNIIGIQALATEFGGTEVSRILFNDTLRDNTNGVIEISSDGDIIFHENGLYKIDWQIAYDDDSIGDSPVDCEFVVNNGSWSHSFSYGSRGQICGSDFFISSLIGIDPPIHSSLVFRGLGTVRLADVATQANIVIVKLA